jgi:hypothetical protein
MTDVGEDQTIGPDSGMDYEARENLWDQQWPGVETGSREHGGEIDDLDEVTGFPDSVGTTDPIEAARDAEPYMAPVDPPVLPGGTEAIHTATGFGTDVQEEMERRAPYRNDADLEEEALLLLRQDSLTSRYNLAAEAGDGVVTIRGVVTDVDDAEHALSIVGEIPGIVDVVDEMTLDPNAGG